jgi:asparagine synthase (glutamine-hydrolysing)
MCGILGIIDTVSSPEKSLLKKMCRIMTHRGPDGEGYYTHGPAALGHRRLSIIDHEGGRQPMSNEDASLWITYNGEIYNFKELRNELIKKGHRFRTRSDTETIIHCYEEYGMDCVKKLRGMFAFGIWDDKRKSLFLARDRLGKKPLYYAHLDTRLVFASELKAIVQDDRIKRHLNLSALVDYFTYHYIPFPETIFKGIHKLQPGHSLMVKMRPVSTVEIDKFTISDPARQTQMNEQAHMVERTRSGTMLQQEKLEIKIESYWDVEYNPDYSLTEDDWVEALREKLTQAVKLRLVSDVPLGAFLSGGIDSSTIVALMSQVQNSPVKTFSIGFKEQDFSEVKYARLVADKFGTDHHEFIVEADAIDILPRLTWEYDEPFADASAIPTYYVSRMARENVTVILSGDGGDETFAGYRRYTWARDMTRYDWLPLFFRKAVFGITSALLPDGMKGKGMLRHLSKDAFERYAGLNTFNEGNALENLFNDDVRWEIERGKNGKLKDYSLLREFYDRCAHNDYLARIQYVDTKTYLAEDILTKVDRASMFCSLETRAPFLDHEVVELVARIPSGLKVKDGQTKYILKRAMRGILPDGILYREKMGFGVPLVHWFKRDLGEYAHDILLSNGALTMNLFNRKYVVKLLDNHRKIGRDLSAHIWALLFFEHWGRNWM